MHTQGTAINYPQKIARILLKVILFIFLFVVFLFLLLLTPPVQRFATTRVENYLQKTLKTEVEIGRISIGLPRKVVLRDVYLEDRTKDTLISGGTIKADIALLKLLSGEVIVKDIQLTDVTAKVKRILPDTAFNFQFIVDAFAPTSPAADSAATPLKMDIDHVGITNSRIIYRDVITGNDMFVQIGTLDAGIDTLDVAQPHYDLGVLNVKDVVAIIKQSKPLVTPEPLAADLAEAAAPAVLKMGFDQVNLDNITVNYGNDVSALYTHFNIDLLHLDGNQIDLNNRLIHFDALRIDNTVSMIRLGRKEQARVLEKEIEKEVAVQKQKDWMIRVGEIAINNNSFAFDNDNSPATKTGIDYAHMRADSLTLHVQDFVMSTDSIAALITEGRFIEKSGFELDALQANLLYANNQSYIQDFLIKTPGSELKRDFVLEYSSLEALQKNFAKTLMDINLENSYIQVKDILAFAPQLASHPALRNRNAVWRLNINGSGTFDRLHFEALQFDGLGNTHIDAYGTLAGLTSPNQAGGNFTIRRLHTTQTDLSLFTGTRLSTPDLNLPESFDINGTLSGNVSKLSTNLNVSSSAGFVGVNGTFTNLMQPARTTYNAAVRTSGLRLGSILRNPALGSVTANLTVNGSGFTPDAIRTRFRGTVSSIGLNNYNYRNIALNGTLNKTVFDVNTDIKDPNINLTASISGEFSGTPSFRFNAIIDSVKTLPLKLTTQHFVFRGNINGEVASMDPDYLKADVLVTKALLVSGVDRLPLDSVHLLADREGEHQFIRLHSDIANAEINGKYRFTELASIIQHNINPYFTIAPAGTIPAVQPYDFTFRADITNSPFFGVFMPGLNVVEPVHIDGSMATGRGLEAHVSSPHLIFQNNDVQNLNLKVTTTAEGLQMKGTVSQLKSGTALNVYNTEFTATALNNIIDFNLNVDDKAAKDKYQLAGRITQPTTGTFALQLKPGNILLNYEQWIVPSDNNITITPNGITANNFVLQKGDQQLAIQSLPATSGAQPLNVTLTNFRIATITGFLQNDSLAADGIMNGTVTFQNIMEQPLFTSDLTINDLSLNKDTVGNVHLVVRNTVANRYDADVTVSGRGNDARITGNLITRGKDVLLDLDVNLQQLQLSSLEGAMAGFIKNADGTISGNMKVTGTLAAPQMNGALNFNNTTFNTTLMGGLFRIDQEQIVVSNDGFRFDNFTVRDSSNNTLSINGNVQTTNFINYYFNLDVDAENFRVLSTTKKDNKVYYGDLVISSDLHVAGTETSPIVDGSLTVNEGTNLTIVVPQPEPGVVEREGIIEFVDFDAPGNDSLFLAYDTLNQSNLRGFDVAVNIEIKKEAILNMIIDAANGDFLNVQGEAILTAGIDPSGKVTLTGSYELQQGSYEFAFNFIRRKFTIEQGSKIVWLGEPTQAEVDVRAMYIANTAPLDLVANQVTETSRNTYLQKLPFEVSLRMTGELLKPLITFDIALPTDRNYGVSKDIVNVVDVRLQQLRQEPSEMNKQVFSLLLLNRFVGDNPFESSSEGFNAGSFVRQSVSKLLTEQLNQLASGLIAGVDLNFDVVSSDDYTTGERRNRTDLNIGLSKRLLNDRLQVSVGSNFALEGPQQSNQRNNNIAGNVAIDYQLSKDGRYMIRFYRRNEYYGVVDGYIIENGLSFIITVDYDRFREILGRKKKAEEEPGAAVDSAAAKTENK